MNTFEEISTWGEKHHPAWIDLFRIAFGVILIIKGIQPFVSITNFALNSLGDTFVNLGIVIGGEEQEFLTMVILHYIVFTHVFGGILIMLGLITRVALGFILPVLLSAVIFANVPEMGIFSVYANFIFALVLLAANIVFLVYGSGPYSLDKYMRKHPYS